MPFPCWVIKTVAESHTHKKEVGGEVYYREAGRSKGCSNQLRPLDESQDGGNFLIGGAILHRLGERKYSHWDALHHCYRWCFPVVVCYGGGGGMMAVESVERPPS